MKILCESGLVSPRKDGKTGILAKEMRRMRTKSTSQKIEHKNARIVIGGAILFALILSIIGVIRFRNTFDFTASLKDIAYTFEDKKVLLNELTYYIMIEEETVNDVALEYDSENPKAYWNLHISQTFVSEEAAKTVREYSIRDQLYSLEAKKAEIKLTEEEMADIQVKAKAIKDDMTEKQNKVLQLKEKQIKKALVQKLLADKYVLFLAEKNKVEKSEKILSAFYGINSKKFRELKKTYKVEINKELWQYISLGDISIN